MVIQVTIGGAAVLIIAGFLLSTLKGAASSILADEFKASAPSMAERLARIAARALPADQREEQLEDWLAELCQLRGRPLLALRFALVNCLLAAPGLARELRPALAPATAGKRAGFSERAEGTLSRVTDPHRYPWRAASILLRLVLFPFVISLALIRGRLLPREIAEEFAGLVEALGRPLLMITPRLREELTKVGSLLVDLTRAALVPVGLLRERLFRPSAVPGRRREPLGKLGRPASIVTAAMGLVPALLRLLGL